MPSIRRKKLAIKKQMKQLATSLPIKQDSEATEAMSTIATTPLDAKVEAEKEEERTIPSKQTGTAAAKQHHLPPQAVPSLQSDIHASPVYTMPLEIQVLTRNAISNLVSRICDSVDLAMKLMDRYPHLYDGKVDGRIQSEVQKIESVCKFLDGLSNGRTFISLPAECSLDGMRGLLEQFQIAKGVRIVAIRLEDNDQQFRKSSLLTGVPRLFLVVSDRSSLSGALTRDDQLFEALLCRLSTKCIVPTSQTACITTDSTPVQPESAPALASDNEATQEIEEETIFPSLFNTPSTLNTITPETMQLQPKPTVGPLHPEVVPRRAYSVPEALSLPWVHQSIPAWRSTTFPTWTLCKHHTHAQGRTPSMTSIVTSIVTSSSVDTAADDCIQSPVTVDNDDGPISVCMHSRELSNSESVITAATSVHSDSDEDESGIWNTSKGDTIEGDSLSGSMDSDRTLSPTLQVTQKLDNRAPSETSDSAAESKVTSSPIAGVQFAKQDQRKAVTKTNSIRPNLREGSDVEFRHHTGSSNSRKQAFFYRCPELGVPFYRMDPPPCNRHYLLEVGCNQPCCIYAHDYVFSDYEILRLRSDSRKSPCTYLKQGQECPIGREECHMGHVCPYGDQCRYGLACKFLHIPGTHDEPPVSEYFALQAVRQDGPLTRSLLRQGMLPMSPPVSPLGTGLRSPQARSMIQQQQLAMMMRAHPPALSIRVPLGGSAGHMSMGLLSPPHLVFPIQGTAGVNGQPRSYVSGTKPLQKYESKAQNQGRATPTPLPQRSLASRSALWNDLLPLQDGKSPEKPVFPSATAFKNAGQDGATHKQIRESLKDAQPEQKRASAPSFRGQKRKFPLRHDTRGAPTL